MICLCVPIVSMFAACATYHAQNYLIEFNGPAPLPDPPGSLAYTSTVFYVVNIAAVSSSPTVTGGGECAVIACF